MRMLVGLVVASALSWSCGYGLAVTTPTPAIASEAKTAPPMPATVQGYRPGSVVRIEMRIADDTVGSTVHGFPVQMNGCADTIKTVRYRSLGSPVRVATVYSTGRPVEVEWQKASTAPDIAGYLQFNACEQPLFWGSYADVVIEYIEWRAAP